MRRILGPSVASGAGAAAPPAVHARRSPAVGARRLALACAGGAAAVAALTAAGALVEVDRALLYRVPVPYAVGDVPLAVAFRMAPALILLALIAALQPAGRRALVAGWTVAALLVIGAADMAGKLWLVQPAGVLMQDLPAVGLVLFSLPSGHAARAMLAAVLLAGLLPRGLRWLPVAAAAGVSLSTVANGHHFLSDVVVGMLMGAAGGLWVRDAAVRGLGPREVAGWARALPGRWAAAIAGARARLAARSAAHGARAVAGMSGARPLALGALGAGAAAFGACALVAAAWTAERGCAGGLCWSDPLALAALATGAVALFAAAHAVAAAIAMAARRSPVPPPPGHWRAAPVRAALVAGSGAATVLGAAAASLAAWPLALAAAGALAAGAARAAAAAGP